jgi:uncharacterized membrane protein YphA (DoxX/SURF4 family)
MLTFLVKHVPLALGVLFLYSGTFKLLFPAEAIGALESFQISHGWSVWAVGAVTAIELYLGTILLLKLHLRYAFVVSTALLFVLTGFLWFLSNMAQPPGCGCTGIGIFKSNKDAALFGLFRNCVLLWAIKLSYDYYFKDPKDTVGPQAAPAMP